MNETRRCIHNRNIRRMCSDNHRIYFGSALTCHIMNGGGIGKMSKQTGIDIIDAHEFKIKWWDLNHEAQKRLLNAIFGTESIAIVDFDYEDDEKENIVDKLASIGEKIDLTDEEIQAISKHIEQANN